jgi:hypothetical protein
MRTRTYVFSALIVVGLFLSAGTEKTSFTKGYHPGDLAPEIEMAGSNRAIQFSNSSGQYTLVNFWAAYDASSRVRNLQLYAKVNKMDSSRIRMYSVSMDERYSVYAGTLKADNLDDSRQLFDGKGLQSPLYRQYNLKNGFGNFLIDDKGVILATNIHPDTLDELLK